MHLPAPARDLALLIARVGLGVVFLAHGWQKLVTNGVGGTAGFFDSVGVPLPTLSAWFATIVELVGGGLLVLGLAVPVAGLLLAVDMVGAWLFVHRGNGVFVSDGGGELVYGRRQADRDLHCSGATTAEARELADARR